MSGLEYIQHSVDDTRLAVKQWNIAYIIRVKWRQATLLDSMSDALWVELTFLDVMEIIFMYSRFMSTVDLFWFMVYAELFDQYV